MNEYNTVRDHLVLREYGRNIQKLVNYLDKIEDREERTRKAHILVELMKQINTNMKENPELTQKIWDDLFIISDFELDVDSPYPKPEKTVLTKKPKPLSYNTHQKKYKHYGENIELLIKKACEYEDEEEKETAIIYIGRLMRSFYSSWNKELIDESVIIKHINELSDGKLDISLEKVKANNLFDVFYKEKKSNRSRRSSSNHKRRKN